MLWSQHGTKSFHLKCGCFNIDLSEHSWNMNGSDFTHFSKAVCSINTWHFFPKNPCIQTYHSKRCSTACTPPSCALCYQRCSPSIRCWTFQLSKWRANTMPSAAWKHWIHYKHFALEYSNRYKHTSAHTVYAEVLGKISLFLSLWKVRIQPCTMPLRSQDKQNTSIHALNVKRDKIHFKAPRVTTESIHNVTHFVFIHALVKRPLWTLHVDCKTTGLGFHVPCNQHCMHFAANITCGQI